jgi:aromatic-amino-acid transaminase
MGRRAYRHACAHPGHVRAGLSPEQADVLREQHGVYVLRSGRMCAAGLNINNVDAVAEALAKVL